MCSMSIFYQLSSFNSLNHRGPTMTRTGQMFFSVLLFIIYKTSFHSKVNCASNQVLRFELKTVPKFQLAPSFATPYVNFYNTREERKKLCYYAYLRANLAYIDYGDVPDWRDYMNDPSSAISSQDDPFLWGMYCSTVPTIHLLRRGLSKTVQITFSESSSDLYSFEKDIVTAHSFIERNLGCSTDLSEEWVYTDSEVIETEHLKNHPEEMELIDLSLESDRRSLCARVRDYVSVDFLTKDVPEAHLYEFGLVNGSSEKYTTMAIPCPTSPRIYLSRGSAEKRIKIISVKSGIDLYEFELDDAKPTLVAPLTGVEQSWTQYLKNKITHSDERTLSQEHLENDLSLTRWNSHNRQMLCKIARRHRAAHVPFVEDTVVEEAQLYAFQYANGTWERSIAIVCSELPHIYLRSHRLQDGGTKIRITFVENPVDHYIHSVETPRMPFTKIQASVQLEESEKRRFALHPFARMMSRENLWNYCSAAQKYLFGPGGANWNFYFAVQEPAVAANKLLLIPYYMNVMQMYGPTYHNGVRDVDLFINCSEWPQLYVRLGQSPKEIISVLNNDEVLKAEDAQTRVHQQTQSEKS